MKKKNSQNKDDLKSDKSLARNLVEARARVENRVSPYSAEVPMKPWDDGQPEVTGSLGKK
jgi:hypothetical protein